MISIIPVKSLDIPELNIYTSASENQLKHHNEPAEGLFIAESPVIIERALDAGYQPVSMLMEPSHMKSLSDSVLKECHGIPAYVADSQLISELTGYKLNRGLLCAMKRKPLPDIHDLLDKSQNIAILSDVENPTNIGAIFRSAAALGIDGLLLSPGCSDPLYRRTVRVSMGTVFSIPWTFTKEDSGSWDTGLIQFLESNGFISIAMAIKDNSVSMKDPLLKEYKKKAIFFGNEGYGLPENVIKGCTHTVCIPMKNGVDSLNVAAASAIAFWELMT